LVFSTILCPKTIWDVGQSEIFFVSYKNRKLSFVVKSLSTNKCVDYISNDHALPCLDGKKADGLVIRPDMITDKDNCGLVGPDSELLPGVLAWYTEKWTKGKVFFSKSYVVYLEDSKKGYYRESVDSSDRI
jgi:hypothetical protein